MGLHGIQSLGLDTVDLHAAYCPDWDTMDWGIGDLHENRFLDSDMTGQLASRSLGLGSADWYLDWSLDLAGVHLDIAYSDTDYSDIEYLGIYPICNVAMSAIRKIW